MNDQTSSSKQGGSQLTTPLSVSFKDTAFMDFINQVNVRPRQTVKKPQKNNHHRSLASVATVATNIDSLTKPRGVPSVADDNNNNNTAGTGSAATADDDSMDCWDELDNIELDSQTMRDLVETEEQFFATQQMEFLEGLSQLENKNPTTPNTKSAPVTPAMAVAAGTTVASATRPFSHLQHQQPQQYQQQIPRSKTNLLPRFSQHIPSNYHPPLPPSSITGRPVTRNNSADTTIAAADVDELAQLRAENERMRIEAQKLRDELYKAKGEVKIVRDNLANTEIDNTHLQERLANETARVSGERQKIEEKLKMKIESLETRLRFEDNEAKEVAFNISVGGGSGNMQTQQQLTPISADNQKQQDAVEFAPVSLLPPSSNRSQQHSTANPLIGTTSNTEEELLKILSSIASASHVTGFGRLVSLSVLLIREAKGTGTNGGIEKFHSQVCSDLQELAEQNDGDSNLYEQLDAIAVLLKRVLGTMHQFVRGWLQQTTNGYANEFAAAIAGSIQLVVTKSSLSDSCGSAIASLCRLLIDVIGLCPVHLGDVCNPCIYVPLITSNLPVQGLAGLLELFTAMIQSPSLSIWRQRIRGHLEDYERFLLATMGRLRAAYKFRDPFMLDGERALLILVASSIVVDEADASNVINTMPRFTSAMVQWFLDEHQSLSLLQPQHRRDEQGRRRVQVFLEHIKCLHVILSEVEDVVAMMGGDNSPMFFAYVAACTRMIVGESMLKWIEDEDTENLGELMGDLLAYVVTEQQAISIQNL